MTRIELLIDEVVVRGLTPSDARALTDALRSRLELRAAAWAAGDGAVAGREEASRRITSSATGDELGDAVWTAVVGTER